MYISVDMGGTNTRIAASHYIETPSFGNRILRRRNTGSYENDLDFIIKSSKRLSMLTHKAIEAIGIGTPGTPNRDRTRIATAKNIPQWNNQPLVVPIEEALDCPVYFDNDAVTAGLGEAYYGDYSGGDFHYLIWGTGVGGATIEKDESDTVSYAAKLAWKQHFSSWDCAGIQLDKDYGKPPESFTENDWTQVMKKFGAHLLGYVERFEPPAIVFGGGLAARHRSSVEAFSSQAGIPIEVSKFGDDSGLVGGLGLIRYEQDPNHRPYVYLEDPED